MLAVLEILTGKKYRLTKGGVVPTVEKNFEKKSDNSEKMLDNIPGI